LGDRCDLQRCSYSCRKDRLQSNAFAVTNGVGERVVERNGHLDAFWIIHCVAVADSYGIHNANPVSFEHALVVAQPNAIGHHDIDAFAVHVA